MPERMTIECPFCKKETIQILHSPEVYSSHTIRVGSNKKTIPKLTHAKDQILSEKCSNCGKSKKEIEKALKEGIPMSHEEIIRRAREAGLPLKIK
jgi:Zn ribbon nucleic-acid-binding protein